MPRILLSAEQAARLGHGQKIELPAPVPSGGLAAACDADGRFLGVVRALSSSPNGGDSAQSSPESIQWKAEKWLAQQLT